METVERYVNNVAQWPDLTAEQVKMVDRMIGKLRFILMDTDEATTIPLLLLMTRGVLTAMIQLIQEVSGALNEVSNVLFSMVVLDL